jgi:hypothetical protein
MPNKHVIPMKSKHPSPSSPSLPLHLDVQCINAHNHNPFSWRILVSVPDRPVPISVSSRLDASHEKYKEDLVKPDDVAHLPTLKPVLKSASDLFAARLFVNNTC